MKYNEIKENEVYYTRVSHIRCFKKHFPEVDSSKTVAFRVISAPLTEAGDLKIDIETFDGQKHLNPRSECGYWYIEPWHFDDIYRSFTEIATFDPVDWRYFIEFTYEDFPDSHYYLEVSKQDWFANELKKGNYILVSSSTKPFRLARILSARTRADAPYGITASSKRLLSNTSAASAIRKANATENKDQTIVELKARINELNEHIRKLEALNADQAETIRNSWKEKEDLKTTIERLRSCVRHLLDQKQKATEIKTGPQRVVEELSKPMDPVLVEVLQENAKLTEALIRLTLELNQYKK